AIGVLAAAVARESLQQALDAVGRHPRELVKEFEPLYQAEFLRRDPWTRLAGDIIEYRPGLQSLREAISPLNGLDDQLTAGIGFEVEDRRQKLRAHRAQLLCNVQARLDARRALFGKADDEREVSGDVLLQHLFRGMEYLLDGDVLADALEHFVGAGLHPDEQTPAPGPLDERPDLLRQPHALIRAHGRRPRDRQPALDHLLRQRPHALALGEERLVLKIDVIEVIPVPQLLEPQRHAGRLEADPAAAIHEGVGTECAAEVAALRRDVIELPLTLQLEIAAHGNQAVVVSTEAIERRQGPAWILLDRPVRQIDRAAGAVPQFPPLGEPLDDLRERLFALPLHRHIDGRLSQAFATKHRRMPASPDHRQIRARPLRCA